MLVPEPKWQSINALIQTKHLQIVNVENAVAEQAKGDQAKLASMMCAIFAADLADNRALLSQHCLKQAVQSNTDKEQRQATCRLFFDYVNAEDGTTAFHKLLGHANTAMFEDLLGLLMQQTEETVMGMSPPDVATKKVYRQAVLCRRLLKRDKARRTLFVHCLLQGKVHYLRQLTGMLLNDDLAIKKLVRGEPQPQPVVVDKTSPAPHNPLLSALLARDRRGDTLMHLALLQGDREALEVLMQGLASNDVHALLTKVPDAAGAVPVEMVDPEKAKARLGRAVKAGRMPMEVANARLKRLAKLDKEVRSYVTDKIAEIEALASDTTGGTPVAPNFDVRKLAGAA
jgi:ankyrin repeat protein